MRTTSGVSRKGDAAGTINLVPKVELRGWIQSATVVTFSCDGSHVLRASASVRSVFAAIFSILLTPCSEHRHSPTLGKAF